MKGNSETQIIVFHKICQRYERPLLVLILRDKKTLKFHSLKKNFDNVFQKLVRPWAFHN
jgi:hypothetical protein